MDFWTFVCLVGANNLIPIEIALKIANKIKANERFSAYIVIPMWPEGNPTSAPTQRILFWQVRFVTSVACFEKLTVTVLLPLCLDLFLCQFWSIYCFCYTEVA